MSRIKPKPNRMCEQCGGAFYASRSNLARRAVRFCGRVCYYAHKSDSEARFWERVNKDGPLPADPTLGPCWDWTGATFSNGYGHVVRGGVNLLTHRVAWEKENGPIPDGLLVLHKCDRPSCLRVSHLFLGTHADNNDDMMSKGRHVSYSGSDHPGFGKYRTHCVKGHALTPDNVILTNHGKSRRCLQCYRISSRAGALRYLARHRERIYAQKNERRRKTSA